MTGLHWLTGTIKAQPDLFRLINEFNQHPQNWVHPEVFEKVPENRLMHFLAGTLSGRDISSRWVSSHLNLSDENRFWDFEDEKKRLALLSWERLDQLARATGATLNASKILTLISKQEIRDLKNEVGLDAYEFSLRRGAHLKISDAMKEFAEQWREHETSEMPERTLGKESTRLGWSVVRTSLGDGPKPLWQRFNLKIPPEFQDPLIGDSPVEENAVKCWEFVRVVAHKLLPKLELRCFS